MTIQLIFQNTFNIISIAMYNNNSEDYYIQPSGIIYTFQWLLLLIDLLAMCFTGQLTIFHWWLRYHKLSTFEFITIQREIESQELQAEVKKNQNPSGGTTNAVRSGLTSGTGLKEGNNLHHVRPPFKHQISKFTGKSGANQIMNSENNEEADKFVSINYLNQHQNNESVHENKTSDSKYYLYYPFYRTCAEVM